VEYRYSSTLSVTSLLDCGGWSTPRPGHFISGKETRHTLYRRLGGPQSQSEQVHKMSPTSGIDPRIVQPVASRYNDWDVPAHCLLCNMSKDRAGQSVGKLSPKIIWGRWFHCLVSLSRESLGTFAAGRLQKLYINCHLSVCMACKGHGANAPHILNHGTA
jgi:hypothetical protein